VWGVCVCVCGVCVCGVCVCGVCVCVVCVCVCVCAVCVVRSETLARLNCKLPGDGRRTKHVGAVLI